MQIRNAGLCLVFGSFLALLLIGCQDTAAPVTPRPLSDAQGCLQSETDLLVEDSPRAIPVPTRARPEIYSILPWATLGFWGGDCISGSPAHWSPVWPDSSNLGTVDGHPEYGQVWM